MHCKMRRQCQESPEYSVHRLAQGLSYLRQYSTMLESVRIDKWLWAVRFYKTRSLASEAVSGGKVQLNGVRVKPSRAVKTGDEIIIHKAGYEYRIEVLGLAEKRGSASVASTLYAESAESRAAREKLAEQRKLHAASMPHPERRPDKKARRQLRESKWRNRE